MRKSTGQRKIVAYRSRKASQTAKEPGKDNFPYSALKFFLLVFSATILRPLTSARNYATMADRKSTNSEEIILLLECKKAGVISLGTLHPYFMQIYRIWSKNDLKITF